MSAGSQIALTGHELSVRVQSAGRALQVMDFQSSAAELRVRPFGIERHFQSALRALAPRHDLLRHRQRLLLKGFNSLLQRIDALGCRHHLLPLRPAI